MTLFDGKTTAGWIQRGGKAAYTVEDGALVGRTVLGEKNSFLCPPKEYADFVLEFEVWVDPKLNSGVQVRSASRPDYRDGVVHGYQIEIDPSERAWSGGIYDEQRRGLAAEPEGRPRRAEGVQGRRVEPLPRRGRGRPPPDLGQRRAGVGPDRRDGRAPASSASRSTRRRRRGSSSSGGASGSRSSPRAATGLAPNTLTDAERAEGWQLLWDGRTTWGWRSAKGKEFPKEGWEIKDGVLSVVETGGAESRAGGDIVTEAAFTAFDLKVEFRLTPGANSGIKYYVDTELNKAEGSAIGLEFQLLDDATHPDAKARPRRQPDDSPPSTTSSRPRRARR